VESTPLPLDATAFERLVESHDREIRIHITIYERDQPLFWPPKG
jgi:hypothetical protein